MTYTELCNKTKEGKLGKLPNFEGYFKWNYTTDNLIFYNGDFLCNADDLNIQNRIDFYYII